MIVKGNLNLILKKNVFILFAGPAVVILLAMGALSPVNAARVTFTATVYYVSTTGDNANDGSVDAPWQTLGYATSVMGGGNTLIIKNGAYLGRANMIEPPSGTADNYTIIKAENDGNVIVDGNYELGRYDGATGLDSDANILIKDKQYVQIEGVKLLRSAAAAIRIQNSSYIKIKRVGITIEGGGTRHGSRIEGSSYVLLEDCWVSGAIRFGFNASTRSHHVIFRRCVVRVDYSATSEPIAGIVWYSVSNMLAQNCIVINTNKAGGIGSHNKFLGGIETVEKGSGGDYNHIYGSMAISVIDGNGQGSGIYADMGGGAKNSELVNNVSWGNYMGAWRSNESNLLVSKSTFGQNVRDDGIALFLYASSGAVKNNLFIDNYIRQAPGKSYNHFSNASHASGSNATTGDPNLLYLPQTTRIAAGENGANQGATILYRRGQDGTLWGEPGYNNLTNVPLWPWPNEERIKADFSEPNDPPANASPTTNNTQRGFCAPDSDSTTPGRFFGGERTLTSYIWEYLGNTCPPEICAYDPETIPPYVTNINPPNNAIEVARNTDISFHIIDNNYNGQGVNINSIVVTVNGDSVIPDSITGTPADYAVSYNPPQDFEFNSMVTVTINAQDLQGNVMQEVKYSFTIEVDTPPEILTQAITKKAYLGKAYSFSLEGIGSETPLVWSINSGTLPEGLSLDTESGVITGVVVDDQVNIGSYNFTVKLTDAGDPDTQIPREYFSENLTIVVEDAPLRITDGLVALYDFSQGTGTTVMDRSQVLPFMNITIESGTVNWIEGRNGIEIISGSIIRNTNPSKLYDKLTASNQITVEIWAEPANLTQTGPSRIVSYSKDASNRNFTLGQKATEYDMRLRIAGTDNNGGPSLSTTGGQAKQGLQHVVMTYDGSKKVFYIDAIFSGNLQTISGDFNFDNAYQFLIGNETTGDRTWLGKVYLVAIYDKALTADEVALNYDAGSDLGGGILLATNENSMVPATFSLGLNYPNPFKQETTIHYSLLAPAHVQIKIYNQLGQLVRTLLDEQKAVGAYQVTWNGLDNHSSKATSGVYLYRMVLDGQVLQRKTVLLR